MLDGAAVQRLPFANSECKKSPSTSALDGSFLLVPSVVRRDLPPRGLSMSIDSHVKNHLLARLPPAEYQRLAARMRPVSLNFKEILYKFRGPIDYVYFPLSGAGSALTIMEDGSAIEVATIGNEGLIGLSALFAGKAST